MYMLSCPNLSPVEQTQICIEGIMTIPELSHVIVQVFVIQLGVDPPCQSVCLPVVCLR